MATLAGGLTFTPIHPTLGRRFGPLETTMGSIGQERRLHENLVDL